VRGRTSQYGPDGTEPIHLTSTSGIDPGPVRYVESGGYDLAWQEFGSGPPDLLFVWAMPNHIESLWRWPSTASFLRGLGALGRVVHYDQRGTGLSSRVSPTSLPSMQERCSDGFSVMDAAGIERAVLLGDDTGAAVAVEMAVAEPERVEALVLLNPALSGFLSDELAPVVAEMIESQWGEPVLIDLVFPSLRDDPRYLEWWSEHLRLSASPREARAMFEMDLALDVTESAKRLEVPTLVLAREGDEISAPEQVASLVESIRDHDLVVTSGDGHVYGAGPGDLEALDAMAGFLGHARHEPQPDLAHRAVLFDDIVSSTSRLAEIGDGRWRQLIDEHDRVMAQIAARLGGRVVKSTGDGTMAVFPTGDAATEAGCVAVELLERIGIAIRVGIHAGELHLRGADIAGMSVNIAARVVDQAGTGEVLVTESVAAELEDRSSLREAGVRALKGVPGTITLWSISCEPTVGDSRTRA
jgi:class 3 adenylate cyclase/pimeloyl-ACP methyl ester carboxylesterase